MKIIQKIRYTIYMKNEENMIKNTYVQLNTSLPLYTEYYELSAFEDDHFHSHEFFEIGITIGGSATHITTGEQHTITRGSVFIIPIGVGHAFTIHDTCCIQNLYLLPRTIFQSFSSNRFFNPLLNQFFLKFVNKEFISIIHLNLPEHVVKAIEILALTYTDVSMSNKYLLDHFRYNCLVNILMFICDAYYTENPQEILIKMIEYI